MPQLERDAAQPCSVLRVEARQHIVWRAMLMGATHRPDGAHHLPRLRWFSTSRAQQLLGVNAVFCQVRGKPVQPESDID